MAANSQRRHPLGAPCAKRPAHTVSLFGKGNLLLSRRRRHLNIAGVFAPWNFSRAIKFDVKRRIGRAPETSTAELFVAIADLECRSRQTSSPAQSRAPMLPSFARRS